MKKTRVLLASIKAGGGHDALRDFLYRQLSKNPELTLVKYNHPSMEFEMVNNLFPVHTRTLTDLIYFYSPRIVSDIFLWATSNLLKDCYSVIKREKPDLIISAHFALSMHFCVARKLFRHKPMIITCIPDYGPPSKSMYTRFRVYKPDKIMVFEKWTMEGTMKAYNLEEKDVLLGGFNPRKEFQNLHERLLSKKNARKKLKECFNYFPYTDIQENKTTVLVTGGSGYTRKILPVLKQIAKDQHNSPNLIDHQQYFVICGTDARLFESLTSKNRKYRNWKNIFPFSWIDPQIYAMLQFSCDFPVLSSIAPATLNELLEAECGPFLIYVTRPGQEIPHIAFIHEKGFGEYIPNSQKLTVRIEKGFTDKESNSFRQRAQTFRKEQQERAEQIGDIIMQAYHQFMVDKQQN